MTASFLVLWVAAYAALCSGSFVFFRYHSDPSCSSAVVSVEGVHTDLCHSTAHSAFLTSWDSGSDFSDGYGDSYFSNKSLAQSFRISSGNNTNSTELTLDRYSDSQCSPLHLLHSHTLLPSPITSQDNALPSNNSSSLSMGGCRADLSLNTSRSLDSSLLLPSFTAIFGGFFFQEFVLAENATCFSNFPEVLSFSVYRSDVCIPRKDGTSRRISCLTTGVEIDDIFSSSSSCEGEVSSSFFERHCDLTERVPFYAYFADSSGNLSEISIDTTFNDTSSLDMPLREFSCDNGDRMNTFPFDPFRSFTDFPTVQPTARVYDLLYLEVKFSLSEVISENITENEFVQSYLETVVCTALSFPQANYCLLDQLYAQSNDSNGALFLTAIVNVTLNPIDFAQPHDTSAIFNEVEQKLLSMSENVECAQLLNFMFLLTDGLFTAIPVIFDEEVKWLNAVSSISSPTASPTQTVQANPSLRRGGSGLSMKEKLGITLSISLMVVFQIVVLFFCLYHNQTEKMYFNVGCAFRPGCARDNLSRIHPQS